MNHLAESAHSLLIEQRSEWPLLKRGYDSLAAVRTREIDLGGGYSVTLQFSPGRLASSAAKVDPNSIAQRKCFLCRANLPPEQRGVEFQNGEYLVLANPFPIFREHFTIAHRDHTPQRLGPGEFATLLDLARAMSPRYTVFYNGPRCGASAPDHLHFQARDPAPTAGLATRVVTERNRLLIARRADEDPARRLTFESSDRERLIDAFRAFTEAAAGLTGAAAGEEPMMNVLARFNESSWSIDLYPRANHRPSFYFAEGDARILLSPAAAEMAGTITLPVERDFERLTAEHIRQMYAEVSIGAESFDELCARLARGAA